MGTGHRTWGASGTSCSHLSVAGALFLQERQVGAALGFQSKVFKPIV